MIEILSEENARLNNDVLRFKEIGEESHERPFFNLFLPQNKEKNKENKKSSQGDKITSFVSKMVKQETEVFLLNGWSRPELLH